MAGNATARVARKWLVSPAGHFAGDRWLLGQHTMNDESKLTPWQRFRTRVHLQLTALRTRMTVGVRAVLIDGTRVLLVKHTYTPGWQFPGGGVEPGETAETAAALSPGKEAAIAANAEATASQSKAEATMGQAVADEDETGPSEVRADRVDTGDAAVVSSH